MQRNRTKFWQLIVGTIGVVYGDIGTSPLYAIKKCFADGMVLPTETNILGIISLIFWSLMIVVTIKYICLILQADNRGEGGILSLSTLILRNNKLRNIKFHYLLIFLGLLGAALLYGDGIITPAISVLGALEGLTVISPKFHAIIVPLSILFLITLFWYQKHGTAKIGNLFGPVMIAWFLVIGSFGLIQIIQTPHILLAINPLYAIKLVAKQGLESIYILGGVVLTITGVEALYADLGHFSKRSIRLTWFYLILPCLFLNYAGQGALLLTNKAAIENPFYMLVPSWALIPTIILATIATILASQAVISGIFSITSQAIMLGYLPKMRIIHTSANAAGQVYVPFINDFILVCTTLAVLIFKSSENLASAYGITVTGIMVITTFLTIILALQTWKWSILRVVTIFAPLFLIDLLFFGVNLTKIFDGGWFTIIISIGLTLTMLTWRKGREILAKSEKENRQTISILADQLKKQKRIPGAAIFLSRTPGVIPNALKVHLKYNKYLHKRVFLLSIDVEKERVPKVHPKKRIKVYSWGNNIYQIIAYYGFTEIPNISNILQQVEELGFNLNLSKTPFFISHGIPQASSIQHLKGVFERLFIFLSNNSASATDFFKLPHANIVEIGIRFRI